MCVYIYTHTSISIKWIFIAHKIPPKWRRFVFRRKTQNIRNLKL